MDKIGKSKEAMEQKIKQIKKLASYTFGSVVYYVKLMTFLQYGP